MVSKGKAFDEFAAQQEHSIQHDSGCLYSFYIAIAHSALECLVKQEGTEKLWKKIQRASHIPGHGFL